jgi:hypothetical protein
MVRGNTGGKGFYVARRLPSIERKADESGIRASRIAIMTPESARLLSGSPFSA